MDFDKTVSSQIVCTRIRVLFTYVVMATLIPFQVGSFPRKTLTLYASDAALPTIALSMLAVIKMNWVR